MDTIAPELQKRPPRSIRRRRKEGDYDAWAIVYLTLLLSVTSIGCCVVGWIFIDWALVLLLFGVLLSPFAFLPAIGSLINIINHKWLVKYGLVVVGEIISSDWGTDEYGFGGYHDVSYKFVAGDGVEIQGKWSHADQPFWESKCGDKFIVIYKPGRPSTHIAYESALFEAR